MRALQREREFFIDNLLVRVHRCFWCTGLAPWEFESPFPGSLISTFLALQPRGVTAHGIRTVDFEGSAEGIHVVVFP